MSYAWVLSTIALYIYAGLMTFRNVVLTSTDTDDPDQMAFARATVDGQLAALVVKGCFVLAWPLWLAIGWLRSRVSL